MDDNSTLTHEQIDALTGRALEEAVMRAQFPGCRIQNMLHEWWLWRDGQVTFHSPGHLDQALEWLFNLFHGVSKSGGKNISDVEWKAALELAQQALERYEQTAEGGNVEQDE